MVIAIDGSIVRLASGRKAFAEVTARIGVAIAGTVKTKAPTVRAKPVGAESRARPGKGGAV